MLYPRYLFRKKIAFIFLKDYLKKINNFLEIGAGSGDFSKTLLDVVEKGDVIDFSDKAIVSIEKKINNKQANVFSGDFLNFEFKNKYPLVISFEVMEHIKDDQSFLKKAHDVLDKDGLFLFSVPSRMKNWGATDEIAGHYRRYEKKDLIRKLGKANFEIIEFASYGFPILNITSKIRDKMYGAVKKDIDKDKSFEELSEDSGLGYLRVGKIKKVIDFMVNFLFGKFMVSVYANILKPFNKYDLGDGYLCLVKKKDI